MASTTNGIVSAKVDHAARMTYNIHSKYPGDVNSISCNSIMQLLEANNNNLFICTESGGLNKKVTRGWQHFDTYNGMSTDIMLSMTEEDKKIWIIASNQIIAFCPENETSTIYDWHFWGEKHSFMEAIPQFIDDKMVVGTRNGILVVPKLKLERKANYLPLVFTSMEIPGKTIDYAINKIGRAHV